MIKAWLDGGSSDPEAEVDVAPYVEDPSKTYLSFWIHGAENAGVVLGRDETWQLVTELQNQLSVEAWFAVEYGSDANGWADTRHGDRFHELMSATRFVDTYAEEFQARGDSLRIVRRTKEVINS